MEFVRKAIGAVVAIVDDDGRVLLMRRAYPPHDWVLPGGNAEADESPAATVRREVGEETGLAVEPEGLIGVYYHRRHQAGEFVELLFRASLPEPFVPVPDPDEVAALDLFAPDALPEPINANTRRRIRDGLAGEPLALPIELPPEEG